MPVDHSVESLTREIKQLAAQLGRTPKSTDSYRLTCAAQSVFGGWNKALKAVFGIVNQSRYNLSETEALLLVKNFVVKYQRLPLRQEFDGKTHVYYESILNACNASKWSEVIAKVDLSDVRYFHSKFGTGKKFVIDGITYLSNQEKLIGEYLRSQNITFEKEVPYNNCSYVFDFYLPEYDAYIEYYGLSDDATYKARIALKQAKYAGRRVIEIYKHHNTINKLSEEVQRLQSSGIGNNTKV
jgi:hypothetical protein